MLDFFHVQCTSYRIMVEASVSACRLAELDMSQLFAWLLHAWSVGEALFKHFVLLVFFLLFGQANISYRLTHARPVYS